MEVERKREGMPVWVKVSAAITLAVIVLAVVALAYGNGRHGPGQHDVEPNTPASHAQ